MSGAREPFSPLAATDIDGWRRSVREWLHMLPDNWRLPVHDYVMHGDAPPLKLRPAIENDLARTLVPATDADMPRLRTLLAMLATACPQECWGSPDAVAAWIAAGGVNGQLGAAAPAARRAA